MEKQQIFKELGQYKKVLEDKGYQVIYIGLYGSQNYNLDDEASDIDCKAIIMPSLHDIIFRNKTSKVVECENGNIDVKDLVTFYEVIRKGNFSYIESIIHYLKEYKVSQDVIKDIIKLTDKVDDMESARDLYDLVIDIKNRLHESDN